MSVGQGSVIVNQKQQTSSGPPGPPFVITSADNGLSVDPISGRIVLGQDAGIGIGGPASFLNNREIPMQGFDFNMIDSIGNAMLTLTENIKFSRMRAFDYGSGIDSEIVLQPSLQQVLLHVGNGNSIDLLLDLSNETITGKVNVVNYLKLDPLNGAFFIGDGDSTQLSFARISQAANSFDIFVQDPLNGNKFVDFFSSYGSGNGDWVLADGTNSFRTDVAINSAGGVYILSYGPVAAENPYFFIDPTTTFSYKFGDIAGTKHSTLLTLDDNSEQWTLSTTDNPFPSKAEIFGLAQPGTEQVSIFTTDSAAVQTFNSIDGVNHSWSTSETQNGTFLRMQGFNQTVEAGLIPGTTGRTFLLDMVAKIYRIGDVDGANNNTILAVVDSGSQVQINATNGLRITGDPVMLHTGNLSDSSAASLGTLTNAPSAGNPTKWITIDDNGTPRFIPTWT